MMNCDYCICWDCVEKDLYCHPCDNCDNTILSCNKYQPAEEAEFYEEKE